MDPALTGWIIQKICEYWPRHTKTRDPFPKT
jgi:hypothetical protein